MVRNTVRMAVAAALCVAGAAQAQTLVFGTLAAGTGPASGSFATLTPTLSGPDVVLTLNVGDLSAFGGSAFVSALNITVPQGSTFGSCCISTGATTVTARPGDSLGGTGASAHFEFDPSAVGGSSIQWTWQGPSLTGAPTFVLHVTGADTNAFYTASPIPEPASVAMMLAGLGLVGALSRRRG